MIELLTATVFFIALTLSYYMGFRFGERIKQPNENQLTEAELMELRRRDEGFKNIMNYDYKQALQRQVK